METPTKLPKLPKNKKKLTLISAGVVAVLILFFLISHFMKTESTIPNSTFTRKRGGPCPGETRTYTMQDPYMRGVLEEGQKFNVILNYYDCNTPRRGEYVYYQLHHSMDPVVKIIRGVPGDKFSISKDSSHKAWNLEVNGEKIYSEVDKKEAYFFGGPVVPPLGLYEKSHKGVIAPGDVLILSSWPPGDIDSGLFGIFSLNDVVGKVFLIEGQKPPQVLVPPTPVSMAKPAVNTPPKAVQKTAPVKKKIPSKPAPKAK